jgi:hypothetical protein
MSLQHTSDHCQGSESSRASAAGLWQFMQGRKHDSGDFLFRTKAYRRISKFAIRRNMP